MDILYTLVPMVLIVGVAMVGVLAWAIKSGQYEDLEGSANRILLNDDEKLLPKDKKNASENEAPLKK